MKATALAVALAGLSLGVDAAGLGKLTVLSGLGQPLRAEIELSATKAELSSMNARLAPPETFKQAGVEFTSAIAGVKFDIAKRRNGKPYLKLSSDQAVSEPFLDLLIQLDWAQGRLVREYTFLLDPPEALLARKQQVAPVSTAESVPAAPPAKGGEGAAAPKAAMTGTREVKRGDTLRGIADDVKPEGISVDQMLVAIFRANPDAFIKGNMNRMRSGAILTIPDREAIAAIEHKEARREVRAQAASFNAYRRRVAESAAAAEAPAESAAQQAASGKIAPRVEEKTPAAAAEPTDQLKVSKSDAAAAKGGKAEQDSLNRIATLQEEVVTKEKALKEASSRLADLEKNVAELQKLVELKNQSLAELQKQASAKASVPAATQPEPAAPAVPQAPETKTPPPAPAASAAPPAEKAPEAPVEPVKPAEVTAPPPPAAVQAPPIEEKKPEPPKPEVVAKELPVEEHGLLDGLMDNPLALYGGGGLAAALLALLGYRALQRRKEESPPPSTLGDGSAQSVFGATGGQSIDTSASSIQTDFSHSGMAAIDADEGVDPVAEADVYMAYGRDAQAEEILLDALKNEPTRHAIQVKLLEIYAQRKSLKQFETQASELYAQTGGVGGEWEKAAAMGRKLDPANPIYGGKTGAEAPESEAGAATTVGAAAVAAGAVAFAATSASAEPQDAEADKLHDTWAMPSAMNRIEPNQVDAEGGATTIVLPADKAAQAAAPQGVADDLVLDLPELDTAPAPKAPETEAFEPSGLDFDLGLDFAPADTAAPPLTDEESATSVPPEPAIVEKAAVPTEEAVDATHAAAAASDHEETDVFAGTESLVTRSIIDFDMGDAVEPETASPREEAKADVPVMDLERTDVAGTLIDFNLDELTASRPAGDVGVMDLERTDVGGNLLDFNFELEQGTAKQQASGEPTATLDLSGISLDLPGSASSDAAAAIGETTAAAAGQEEAGADGENAEAATKIDLAKAYEEMGDQEGARELLEEVLHEGSAGQQEKARTMLASLGR